MVHCGDGYKLRCHGFFEIDWIAKVDADMILNNGLAHKAVLWQKEV
jgi:hypothetical protein